jgi:hypothetical protein
MEEKCMKKLALLHSDTFMLLIEKNEVSAFYMAAGITYFHYIML